jgi:uncharacterized protein (TIGR03435 family)
MEFDVASVRQNKSNAMSTSNMSLDSGNIYSTVKTGDAFAPRGSYFSATNQSLWRYISFAYKLTGTQDLALRFNFFSGVPASKVPGWVSGSFEAVAEGFDIEARAEGNPTKDQMRLMMQSLLADRFKLAVHRETSQAPVFALVLVKPGKTGPGLRPHPVEDSCPSATLAASTPGPTPTAPPQPAAARLPIACGVIAHIPPSSPGLYAIGGRDVSLDLLASSLPTQTGMATLPRPVIDQTGLSGSFDFTLEWVNEFNAAPDASGDTFQQALKNQLGLKLEPQKAPIEFLVIDHIEHPSAN